MTMENNCSEKKAKAYQNIRQKLTLLNLAMTPCLLLVSMVWPVSSSLRDMAVAQSDLPWIQVLIYFTGFSLFMLIFDLPVSFYSGYLLEQRFGLSNLSLRGWIFEFTKKAVLSFLVSALLVVGLYQLIWHSGERWWIWAWAVYSLFSYGMGKIFPIVIVPLFYRYGPIEQESLKQKIIRMAERYQLPVENVYSLNLSKTTKKANAAFMGMGKTKRVVLNDTLISQFTEAEIEVVVAHELGHFKHGDIWKQLISGFLFSFAGFWLAAQWMVDTPYYFDFDGVEDLAALPLLFLAFYLFYLVLTPLLNGFSRWMEKQADLFALKAYPFPDVFISCMRKLGQVNLSEMNPHPAYEWFFYDHPSIAKRIQMAESWKS